MDNSLGPVLRTTRLCRQAKYNYMYDNIRLSTSTFQLVDLTLAMTPTICMTNAYSLPTK